MCWHWRVQQKSLPLFFASTKSEASLGSMVTTDGAAMEHMAVMEYVTLPEDAASTREGATAQMGIGGVDVRGGKDAVWWRGRLPRCRRGGVGEHSGGPTIWLSESKGELNRGRVWWRLRIRRR